MSLVQTQVPKNKKKKLVKKKKSTILAETVKRKIEDLNKRLDQLEETTDEESVTSHHEISESDSITTGQNKSLKMLFKRGSNLNVNKVNKDLKAMIVTEEKKRSHLRNVVSKLRDHKTEQKTLIDDLIVKNHNLDLEMRKNQSLTNKLQLRSEISEGKLKTVSVLKGSLIDDIDDQHSIIWIKLTMLIIWKWS